MLLFAMIPHAVNDIFSYFDSCVDWQPDAIFNTVNYTMIFENLILINSMDFPNYHLLNQDS